LYTHKSTKLALYLFIEHECISKPTTKPYHVVVHAHDSKIAQLLSKSTLYRRFLHRRVNPDTRAEQSSPKQ